MDPSAWTSNVALASFVHTTTTVGVDDHDHEHEHERDNFFQLVPPTPHNPHAFPGAFEQQHQIRAMPSDSSLSVSTTASIGSRSHRSTSSFDSSASAYGSGNGNGTGWSTIATETETEYDFDLNLDLDLDLASLASAGAGTGEDISVTGSESGSGAGSTFNLANSPSNQNSSPLSGSGTSSQSQREGHSRAPSLTLSIDPRLFAPQPQLRSTHIDKGEQEDDEEILHTAIPQTATLKNVTRSKKSPTTTSGSGSGKGAKSPTATKKRGKEDKDKKKISHARKQTADHIPRPRNAFILFRKHVVDAKLIPASVEMRHQNVSIITAKMWSEAPPDQKAHFNELARIEKEEHMRKYPGYRYQPVYRRTNVIRRRVRKDEAEEEKCRSVAELLIKGKSGDALEEEIKEKILRRTPEGPTPSTSTKNSRSSSRRGSACELSKGALRALRAQARSTPQPSGEWSDISRSRDTSMDVDMPAANRTWRNRPEHSRQSSLAYSINVDHDDDDEDDDFSSLPQVFEPHFTIAPDQRLSVGLGLPEFTMNHPQPQHHQQHMTHGSGQWGEAMAYIHPDMATWTYSQSASLNTESFNHSPDNGQKLDFTFPQFSQPTHAHAHAQMASFSSSSASAFTSTSTSGSGSGSGHHSFPSDSSGQAFLYPQPQSQNLPNENGNEFYTYDTALPFSPSATQFTFPTSDISMPMTFDSSSLLTEGNATPNMRPMSARWDRGHFLPPSSEVPLEGLPFDDSIFEGVLVHEDGVW